MYPICEEDKDLPLGDSRCIMFLNTKGSIGKPGADLDAFFGYLNGGVSNERSSMAKSLKEQRS